MMKPDTYQVMGETAFLMLICVGSVQAFMQQEGMFWLIALALSVAYLVGGVIPGHQQEARAFLRYCVGQAGVIAFCFVNPWIGLIAQYLICAIFFSRMRSLETHYALKTFGITCICIGIGFLFIPFIQYILFPVLVVLAAAGVAAIYLLIADLRITHLATGEHL